MNNRPVLSNSDNEMEEKFMSFNGKDLRGHINTDSKWINEKYAKLRKTPSGKLKVEILIIPQKNLHVAASKLSNH